MGKHVLEEASRCLQCKKPQCTRGCPVGTPVNTAIRLLMANKIQDAGALLFENNPLSVICSLICRKAVARSCGACRAVLLAGLPIMSSCPSLLAARGRQ